MNQVRSLCPKCLKIIPGALRETPLGLIMEKVCVDHGPFQAMISTDLKTYERLSQSPRKVTRPIRYGAAPDKGCPEDCGLCPIHDQHTCLAIMEITTRCDLQCPICLSSSGPEGYETGLATIESALETLLRSEGRVPPLQLSGGEPTLHDELSEIIQSATGLGFQKIEIDTNGLLLSRDPLAAAKLREAGLTGVYLQMDGLTPEISQSIRGKDLVEAKLRAIANCKKVGLQVVLSVTIIPGVNDDHLWEMVQFAIGQELTGINFQPFVRSGRFPQALNIPLEQFTLGHFLHKIERQSQGKLRAGDLSPIPCPDPRCGVICYALIQQGELVPLNRFVGPDRLLDPMADLSDWETVIRQVQAQPCAPGKVSGCCEGAHDSFKKLFHDCDFFSIGCHGMMDAENFDLERAKRCCVHELTAEGKLIPFCLYNIKYRPTRKWC